MRSRWVACCGVVLAVLAAGCSGDGTDSTDGPQTTRVIIASTAAGPTSAPTTAAPTTTTTEPPPSTFPLNETVSFLDSCVTGREFAGGCHCAVDALAQVLDVDGLVAFEIGIADGDEVPDDVAAAVSGCAGAPFVESDAASYDVVTDACAALVTDPAACGCVADRVFEIVPADRIEEYLAADGMSGLVPRLADLNAACQQS